MPSFKFKTSSMEGFGSDIECFQGSSGPIPFDPFPCRFPECNAIYQRKEHLNRHKRSKHNEQQALICSRCGAEFRRSDTLRRHVQRLHKVREPLKRAQKACVSCHKGKTRCEGGVPCDDCVRRNVHCSFEGHTGIAAEQQIRLSTPSPLFMNSERPDSYHWENRQRWIDLYFEIFHPRWPFLHRGTFDLHQEPPLLLQSMMAIGCGYQVDSLHSLQQWSYLINLISLFEIKWHVGSSIYNEKWDASEVEGACNLCFWPIATYQALLLHVILAVVMKADSAVNLDLKASISTADRELLKSLVESCRRLGMFFYPNILSKFEETDLPSFVWVGIEEVKRFSMALYRLCAKLSNSSTEDGPLLHASELQFPVPGNDALWNSVNRDEWEANVKEESIISLRDDLKTRWVSSHPYIIKLLDF
ncbi:C2H2 type zinc finger domain protein [Penicillium angulare]|uniref:C2H2 type zinc finger domain protein n=1 Tax=Penicillium angulare TaxID=116970 RepID=A0A9W9FAD4_9EURO|nr:C2H2 type zinc finger domain protein [Penicillium angulare]